MIDSGTMDRLYSAALITTEEYLRAMQNSGLVPKDKDAEIAKLREALREKDEALRRVGEILNGLEEKMKQLYSEVEDHSEAVVDVAGKSIQVYPSTDYNTWRQCLDLRCGNMAMRIDVSELLGLKKGRKDYE